EQEGQGDAGSELPGTHQPAQRREQEDHDQRVRQQQQPGEALGEGGAAVADGIQQAFEVVADPVDSGVDPLADGDAGHEARFQGDHEAAPSTAETGSAASADETAPTAASRVTRGMTPTTR